MTAETQHFLQDIFIRNQTLIRVTHLRWFDSEMGTFYVEGHPYWCNTPVNTDKTHTDNGTQVDSTFPVWRVIWCGEYLYADAGQQVGDVQKS